MPTALRCLNVVPQGHSHMQSHRPGHRVSSWKMLLTRTPFPWCCPLKCLATVALRGSPALNVQDSACE